MTNVISAIGPGCGDAVGLGPAQELVVQSGQIVLGPEAGPQKTFDGTASTVALSTPPAPGVTDVGTAIGIVYNTVSTVSTGRALTDADDGKTLEVTTALTLTVPDGLRASFGCNVIPPASGNVTIARSGTTLLNGGSSSLTRAAASNAMFGIQARASSANSYVVTGS